MSKVKKVFAASISAIAMLVCVAPAHAVTDLGSVALTDINPGTNFFSFFQFFNSNLAADDYLIKYTFGFQSDGAGAGDISASLVGGDNTRFNSVDLNGSAFTLASGNTLGDLSGAPVFGPPTSNVLSVNFKVLTAGVGAFNGSVSAAPVPEPATWAMMLIGFGMIGFGLRRREKVTTRVRYSMA